MLEVIQDIVFQVTGRQNITYDTDFVKDLEFNSFDIVNIVCAFEERFGVSIPTRELWNLKRVKDVIEYMDKLDVTDDTL